MAASSSDEILAAERARCEAIVSRDFRTLESLLSDDLVHVHATGTLDTKGSYVDGLRERLTVKSVTRGELKVRPFDDMAVVTGTVTSLVCTADSADWRDVTAYATQVWARLSGRWQMVSYHASRIASH